MARYLVVAHQTAASPELLGRLAELRAVDPGAAFAILVPATPVTHLLSWEEGETAAIARKRAEQAKSKFQTEGLTVIRAGIGDASPLLAIEDELRAHPGEYDAIVLSTLPPGVSRWLRLDVHCQAERRFDIPVFPVVARQGAEASGPA